MPAEVSDYEYERSGYERRLAGAKAEKNQDLVKELEAQIKEVDAVIKDHPSSRKEAAKEPSKKETTAREPGERAVEAKPEKRG